MFEVAEKMSLPRALYCQFPLGRPLGKPSDAAFQRDVLERGLALLRATEPVLDTYPEVIETEEAPMVCAMPPRFDPDAAPAVDEAQGLRAAYDRALHARGVTGVGRAIDAETIPAALDVLHQWAGGASWKEVPLPGKNTVAVTHDIRAYYEEAATQLVSGPVPGGRAAEAWFFDTTEAGKTLMAARKALQEQEAPFPFWFYMAPAHR